MAAGVVSFMTQALTLKAFHAWIISLLALDFRLSPIKQVSESQKYFVLRISNSWKLEFDMEIYRCCWGIELLWKFLKMPLKLDKLITKNLNGIAIQIYATLIVYLILQVVKIPQQWGQKLLDKLRYLLFVYVQRNQLFPLDD